MDDRERTLSQKLDLVIATLDRLQDAPPSPARDKAIAKWQDFKRKIEAQVQRAA